MTATLVIILRTNCGYSICNYSCNNVKYNNWSL